MSILILGSSGLLGSTLTKYFFNYYSGSLYGVVRSSKALDFFSADIQPYIISGVDILLLSSLEKLLDSINPDVVINCIGITNKFHNDQISSETIAINSLFPHQLYSICKTSNRRLIHFSTDCVFSGLKGNYNESDIPDSSDLYGKSKHLGELDFDDALTLRTSMIGHELFTNRGLLEWFLSQHGSVNGYKNAIFSGLPTIEIARSLRNHVLPNKELSGLYHLSSNPISKYYLLKLIAKIYNKNIEIIEDKNINIDRSLNSGYFSKMTGYESKEWPELIDSMFEFNLVCNHHV
tara:strand:- start:432 stop:1307 length:876 start_codon:yes stop_codon:yes gene_type:complete